MEEISWLEKVTNEEVLGRVNEDRQIFGKGNNDGLAMFWNMMDFFMKKIEGRMKGKPTRGRRRIQMLHDMQMVLAMLHSNVQQRTEVWRHRERMSKTCCTAEDYWWWWWFMSFVTTLTVWSWYTVSVHPVLVLCRNGSKNCESFSLSGRALILVFASPMTLQKWKGNTLNRGIHFISRVPSLQHLAATWLPHHQQNGAETGHHQQINRGIKWRW